MLTPLRNKLQKLYVYVLQKQMNVPARMPFTMKLR